MEKRLDDKEKLKKIKQPVPRPDGKDVCRKLKELRKAFADANNILYFPEECKFEGPCAGTCAHCDAELEKLEWSKWSMEILYPQYEIIAKEIYKKDQMEKLPEGITLGYLMSREEWEKYYERNHGNIETPDGN